ncbi:hypothetical protein [Demequina lutea]|uniref:Signal transduction histidine kinase n=1 Tax=Demequina lutea TaxID=431489 RepID=A0A7Z0CIW2_9MICO|nr:hypothetical protein [Demequina lutea]NYI40095.1 hypothetical protein [Demequina lutea]
MIAPADVGTVDTTQLLGLTSPAARVVMWLFVFSNFLYAFATIDEVKHPEPVLLAVLIVNSAVILLVREHADPFPMLWTIAVLAAVALSTVLVAFQLPDVGPPGRASWHLGSNAWMLFFLAMRRRPGAAWVGYGIMATITVTWSLSAGRGVVDAVFLLDTHAAILFVATLFALNLRRTARGINEFDRRAVSSAIEAAEGATSAQIRKRRVVELRASAAHLLEALVNDGPPIDSHTRTRYATAEALLRDGVRGRSLMSPRIAAAATAARERGVEVTLLDDRGQGLATGDAMVRLSEIVVEQLDALSGGSVTVRLAPKGRRIAVSIVASDGAVHPRIELDGGGHQLVDKEG